MRRLPTTILEFGDMLAAVSKTGAVFSTVTAAVEVTVEPDVSVTEEVH